MAKSTVPSPKTDPTAAVEAATQEIGNSLFSHLHRRTPTVFERRWWDDRILAWAMADESVKVQMFRFVDVLPMLKTATSVTQHLHEYFEEVRTHLPWAVRLGLDVSQPNTLLGKALALNARSNAERMARRFIAGTTVDEVFETVSKIRQQGFAFTLDLLGEAVISESEAERYHAAYLHLISELAPKAQEWVENKQLDRDAHGNVPRVNTSLKLSALYSQFRPVDPAGTAAGVKARLRPLIRTAREHETCLHIDMEHYAYKDLTLEIFRDILMEDEFRDFADIGIVIQAYLPEAERDLHVLRDWAERRGTPIWIRLVKGAYWDYETVAAESRGWPVPVYQEKWQSDENYERQSRYLMENHQWLRPALASHNLRSLAHGLAWARHYNIPQSEFEIQMLYGMGTEQAQLFAELGHRVRIYTPFGELIPGMAYFVRRLLENTSNESFLRASFTEHVAVEDLLMKPVDVAKKPHPVRPAPQPRFPNEPLTDFAVAANRQAMLDALDGVRRSLGRDLQLIINGRPVETKGRIASRNPSQHSQIVGQVYSATPEEAVQAIAAAKQAFPNWARMETQYRAEYLELAAAEMRRRKFELSAWMVYECGKPWIEADADVAEAIDFCLYYAGEMRRLAVPRQIDLPGEENTLSYRPRGVAVVIAPWNFPLAILTGMTAAALVTGNTVIMKPAEQSPVIAGKLMEIFESVGLPAGVLNFVPGVGEEIGPELVGSPDVDVITFTGSLAVGLAINQQAAVTDERQESVKKVVAEMGGKNAIIVDDDADLDEAVLGVLQSAFGYSGQKCSACSRAIVLDAVYEDFLARLVPAVRSLKVGPAIDPGTSIGPVIDEEAYNRIQAYIEIGREEGHVELCDEPDSRSTEGYFIGPHIFSDVAPNARIAQEEIFGPVLAVIRAKDFDTALQIANGTRYALTGGVYSRSPVNLKRARHEMVAGNLYLNRGITGALVERQPFGGFKMSGIGSKAGGPDYLLQFMIPINVTENTLRRGFAPPPVEEAGE